VSTNFSLLSLWFFLYKFLHVGVCCRSSAASAASGLKLPGAAPKTPIVLTEIIVPPPSSGLPLSAQGQSGAIAAPCPALTTELYATIMDGLQAAEGQHVTMKLELRRARGASSEVVNLQVRVADLERSWRRDL
jgi:hypothetical protein